MQETDAVDSAVTLLYEAALDESRRGAALAAFARAFNAPQALRMRFDFDRNMLSEFSAHGHDADVLQRYTGYYHAIDPGGPPAIRSRVGQWLGDEQLFDRKARDQQEYAVDFALPSGVGWQAGGKIESTGSKSGLWFGVTRRPDDAPFGVEGERIFKRMLPHLQQAARLETRVKALARGHSIAQASLDALAAAVCVLDARRRAVLLNRRGEQLFGRGDQPLAVTMGRLVCTPSALDERLSALVHKACVLKHGGAFQVPRRGLSLPLQVMVMPLPQHHDVASLRPEPLAMVVAMDPQAPHLAQETYQALFGLTDAESSLLFALVQGDNLAHWAEARRVTVNTARTHLATVFAKTGVNTQARLMRLARTLPPMS